jgi:hypothetical protein
VIESGALLPPRSRDMLVHVYVCGIHRHRVSILLRGHHLAAKLLPLVGWLGGWCFGLGVIASLSFVLGAGQTCS